MLVVIHRGLFLCRECTPSLGPAFTASEVFIGTGVPRSYENATSLFLSVSLSRVRRLSLSRVEWWQAVLVEEHEDLSLRPPLYLSLSLLSLSLSLSLSLFLSLLCTGVPRSYARCVQGYLAHERPPPPP